MMYRCRWGAKEGQETGLAVEITREGFEWAWSMPAWPTMSTGCTPTALPGSAS